jgi:DNA-binding MarR family transcriptional regulator
MAEAGFSDRRFPDGRVLRLCSGRSGSTISAIGRELGITRQGAGKVVRHLGDQGYVDVAESATSKREKSVTLTSRGNAYLLARRSAARAIEEEVTVALGEHGVSGLFALVDLLDSGESLRVRTYLQRSSRL